MTPLEQILLFLCTIMFFMVIGLYFGWRSALRQGDETRQKLLALLPGTRITDPEPMPTHNNKPALWDLVIADMRERDEFGQRKYGTRLQPFNGRDMLKDAYQESIDQAVYLRGEIYQRDGR